MIFNQIYDRNQLIDFYSSVQSRICSNKPQYINYNRTEWLYRITYNAAIECERSFYKFRCEEIMRRRVAPKRPSLPKFISYKDPQTLKFSAFTVSKSARQRNIQAKILQKRIKAQEINRKGGVTRAKLHAEKVEQCVHTILNAWWRLLLLSNFNLGCSDSLISE